MVVQDLTVRYRASFLGFVWTLLNPLMLMVVMWFVFSRFGRIDEENYALFILSGLMTWTFFSQSIERGQASIIANAGLIQKIYLPKLVFPVATVTSNLVNLFFFLAAYTVIAIVGGHTQTLSFFLVIPGLFMLYSLGLGGAVMMASLNVFFRDFTHLTSVLLRALFYLTPIIYPPGIMGDDAATLLRLNPLYYPVVVIRDAIYYGRVSDPQDWAIGFATGALMLTGGLVLFSATEERFVYYA